DEHACGGLELVARKDLRRYVETRHRRIPCVVSHSHQEPGGVVQTGDRLPSLAYEELYPVGQLSARIGEGISASLYVRYLPLNAVGNIEPEFVCGRNRAVEFVAQT